ncbi:MAG: hypothetical protein IJ485_02705 [Lachnospiraceae bacterium]|nr:hypothetical protein [Lachnospiraceae bacterium]
MDNFMDKLAQKFNAQEMIKANSAAEAAENKRMQEQLAAYEECLKEMRSLNLTNVEMSEKLNDLIDEVSEKIEAIVLPEQDNENEETVQKLTDAMNALKEQVTDYVHKENVKVYRNVQAVVVEELTKQTETLQAENKALKESLKMTNIVTLAIGILGTCSSVALLVMYLLNMFKIL